MGGKWGAYLEFVLHNEWNQLLSTLNKFIFEMICPLPIPNYTLTEMFSLVLLVKEMHYAHLLCPRNFLLSQATF